MPQIRGIHIPKEDSLKNYFINSNFDFWQKQSSFTSPVTNTYTADRFVIEFDGTIGTFTNSRQAFTVGQTAVPNEPKYFYRWDNTVAGSASTFRRIVQRIESVRTFAGKTATVSFWAKADSARSVTMGYMQHFGTGGAPSANIENTSVATLNLTTSFQKFTVTYTVPSISGKTLGTSDNDYLAIQWNLPLNTIMTIDIAQVMINEGPVAAPYAMSGNTIEQELINCQRYFEKSYNAHVDVGTNTNDGNRATKMNGAIANAGTHDVSQQFLVTKRANPTVTLYTNAGTSGAVNVAGSARSASAGLPSTTGWYYILNSSGVTWNDNESSIFHFTANAEL